MLNKELIRQKISCLIIQNKFQRDQNLLLELKKFNHKVILGFYPIKLEPDIMPFLIHKRASNHIVGLPTIVDGKIFFKVWNSQLVRGKFDILEPDTNELINLSQFDIICITPLVACTADGKRLGRGGGYYDRFFTRHPNLFKVGVCYKEQIIDWLPTEPHDIKLDIIISC